MVIILGDDNDNNKNKYDNSLTPTDIHFFAPLFSSFSTSPFNQNQEVVILQAKKALDEAF